MDDLRSEVELLEDKVCMTERDYKIMKEQYELERGAFDKKVQYNRF